MTRRTPRPRPWANDAPHLAARVGPWLLPLGAVAVALLLRLALAPILGVATPFMMFVLAVALSAWWGGLWPGLLATAVAAVAGIYFVIPPEHSFELPSPVHQTQVALFVTVGGVVSGFAESLLRAQARTREEKLQRERLLERMEAEQALLAQSERRYRTLVTELERRVAERTAALQTSNRELETFSYSVSHDLRAPLRGVDGFAKILLQQYGPSFDPQGRHYLERIRAGTQRMGKLIDDLLRLSRISRTELRWLPVDLAAIGRDVVEELRKASPDRAVDVVIAPSLRAVGDPQLLRVVLDNLLGNAWKFSNKTERARIELGESVREGVRTFHVRDNGVGFDMEFADKLFTAFQRLHDASEFEGTGIGLATVQRIVSRHGGRVWAESRPDEATTFWFTIGEAPRS